MQHYFAGTKKTLEDIEIYQNGLIEWNPQRVSAEKKQLFVKYRDESEDTASAPHSLNTSMQCETSLPEQQVMRQAQ